MDVTIERGLHDQHRVAAALIFEEAFGVKQRTAVADREKRLRFFERTIDGRHVISARRDDELLGFMGLASRHEPYRGGVIDVAWDPRQLRDLLGWRGAAWAQWGTRLARRRLAADELYIDGLAVTPHARSGGIGTRLIGEAKAIAAELGLGWLRLDVVDTNPRAQALYERLGFRITKVQSLGYQRHWTGFGEMISMELAVGA